MAPRKETCFYIFRKNAPDFDGPGDERLLRKAVRSTSEYTKMFDGAGGCKAIGEASVYYMYRPDVLDEIAAELPGVKAIAILRDPARRAFSAYSQLVRDGRETAGSFAEGLAAEDARVAQGWEYIWHYRRQSLYVPQVRALISAFGADRVKLFRHEDFVSDPLAVAREAFSFLGVDPEYRPNIGARPNVSGMPRSPRFHSLLTEPGRLKNAFRSIVPGNLSQAIFRTVHNANIRPLEKPMDTIEHLSRSLAPDIQELQSLIGRDLSRWMSSMNGSASSPLLDVAPTNGRPGERSRPPTGRH
ncbi:MAG: hypothetical protein QOG43_2513 [Actinomycetota bacterium]|jgi:hypothetical protein|nr:hypothetical protein [Actinomycetota bacterium]